MTSDSDNFQKFCLTGDALFFSLISNEYQKLAVSEAKMSLKKSDSNRYIASKILNYFGLFESKSERDNPPQIVLNNFTVGITGAFPGDVLIGKQKIVHGALSKVHGQIIFPQKVRLDLLRQDKHVWRDYLNKLGSIPYYSEMTIKEREDWLAINEDPTDSAIGEYNQTIEFIQPGRSDFLKKLNEEDAQELFSGKEFSADEAYSLFRKNNPSRARRPTLILLKSFWQLSIDFEYAEKYNGTVIDVGSGKIVNGVHANKNQKLILIDQLPAEFKKMHGKYEQSKNIKIGFLVQHTSCNSQVDFDNIIFEILNRKPNKKIYTFLENWNPSAYKSLLQKLIRYHSPKVIVFDKEYSSEEMLLVCISKLSQHPGALVPDIQRFVTGLESAFKRVFVTIAEDSSFSNKHNALTIISCALLAQRVKNWVPATHHIKVLFSEAINSLKNPNAYDYGWREYFDTIPYSFSDKNEWAVSSAIMDTLRSFKSDLAMVRNISNMYITNKVKFLTAPSQPTAMHFRQFVDQHWAPNIAYFYSPTKVLEFVKQSKTKEIYSDLFHDLWNKSSGLNPRRKKVSEIPTYITSAQDKYLQAMFTLIPKQEIRLSSDEHYSSKYKLSESWIAALIGGIEVKMSPEVIVSIKPDSVEEFAVMRKPSRNTNENDRLSETLQEKAISIAKDMCKKGIKLSAVQVPHTNLRKTKAFFDNDEWTFSREDGPKKTWEEMSLIVEKIPTFSNNDYDVYTHTSQGIVKNPIQEIKKIFSQYQQNNEEIQQVLYLLGQRKSSYEFPRIGREGGGTKERVSTRDTMVFHIFHQIANLLPALIVPRKHNPTVFDFYHRTVLWEISRKFLKTITSNTLYYSLKNLYDRRNFTLKSYQRDALQEMNEKSTRGNFLWLVTGSGKTLISLTYIKNNLKSINPQYIIYTLPAEAIASVGEEIKSFGFNIDIVLPIKNNDKKYPSYMNVISNCKNIRPGVVTIIEHDYLRKCNEKLIEIAPSSFVVFDECHKLLNDTLRTGTALDLSRMSKHFIAMTGTPVVDNKIYKLVNWFEQIYSEIEITEKNFWVGANSMISKLVDTGVKVNEKEVISKFSEKEWLEYESLVPALMGGKNTYPQSEDFSKATEVCYQVCDKDLIKETINNISQGVHLITRNKAHAKKLHQSLLNKGISSKDVLLMIEKDDSIKLTTETVKDNSVYPYKVVITPMRKSSGYDIAYLSVQIYSIYPSNQATRTQLRGRINRISQKRKEVLYIIVHCGILTRIMENHHRANSLQSALSDLAERI